MWLPDITAARTAVSAPGAGSGYWAGGPSAALDEDATIWLAYRLRRPVGDGRGYAVMIARSTDGEHFEPVLTMDRDSFDCDSLERPALVRRPDGGWRLYASTATPGTLHWQVLALDAGHPSEFDPAGRQVVWPGTAGEALKDPVVHCGPAGWQAWVCAHDISDPAFADAMTTRYATSSDGLDWTFTGTALAPNGNGWAARGTRIAAVLSEGDEWLAYYDGRADFSQNWEERTGVAIGAGPEAFSALPGGPSASSPYGSGSVRYLSFVEFPGGDRRFYYEAARPDGAHDLLTEYAPRPDPASQSEKSRPERSASSTMSSVK